MKPYSIFFMAALSSLYGSRERQLHFVVKLRNYPTETSLLTLALMNDILQNYTACCFISQKREVCSAKQHWSVMVKYFPSSRNVTEEKLDHNFAC